MQSNYRLVMRSGPSVGKVYPLDKADIYVGRDLSNDIVINDPEISRRHARLFNQGTGYVIEDLGSTNGTFVNGQRLLGPHVLRGGDTITFGERLSMVYEASDVDQDATMVSPAARGAYPPPQASTQVAPPDQEPPSPPPQPVEVYPEPQGYQPPQQSYPPPQQNYQPPQQNYPPPQASYQPPQQNYQGQQYAGQVPGAYPPPPPEPYAPPAPRRGPRTWLIILIVLLLLCICVGLFAWFAPTSFWCLFPIWPAGACP